MRHVLGLAGVALLAACSTLPAYRPPVQEMPRDWRGPRSGVVAGPQLPEDLAAWLAAIGDPKLQSLLQASLRDNLDIGTARARVEQARQQIRVSGAAWWPTLGAGLSTQRARTPLGNGRAVTATVDEGLVTASWELDLFGATRSSVDSAEALLGSTTANAVGTRLLVIADVLLDYADLCTAQRRVAISRASAASQAQLVELILSRRAAGLATDADVAQAEATLALTRASSPLLEAQIDQDIHALAILAGQPPETLQELAATVRPMPELAPVPLGVPAEMVRLRPDVIAAERQVAASYAQLGVSHAALFPSLTLTAGAGRSGASWTSLRSPDALVWDAGASVLQPLFQGGRLRAGVQASRAALEQQQLQYRKTVLSAFGEVEDALSRMNADTERTRLLGAATDSASRARDRSEDLYAAGLGDLTAVLLAETTLLTSQDSLAQSVFNRFADGVTLFKAMGGGWDGQLRTAGNAAPNRQDY